MEMIIPYSASTVGAQNFADDLKLGKWSYPKSEIGGVNSSFFVFDLWFFTSIAMVWIVMMFQKRPPASELTAGKLERLMHYCTQGGPAGPEKQLNGLNKYVSFFTLEEVATWLGVISFSALVTFKIMCGAENVNAGYVIILFTLGLAIKLLRQGTKGRPIMMLPTFLALLTNVLLFMAYTDSWGAKKEFGKHAGQNALYMWAGFMALVTISLKMYLTIIEDKDSKQDKVKSLFKELHAQNFMYYMTGIDVVLVGSCVTVFMFCEAILISYAATKWYAVPFYALFAVPVYYMASNGYAMTKANSQVPALLFNILLCALSLVIIFFSQSHVCSFPGPDGEHIVTGCAPIGLKIKSHEGARGDELVMQKWSIWILGISTSLFMTLVWVGACFTQMHLARTVDKVCSENGTNMDKYLTENLDAKERQRLQFEGV
jgi:hypothetical protein